MFFPKNPLKMGLYQAQTATEKFSVYVQLSSDVVQVLLLQGGKLAQNILTLFTTGFLPCLEAICAHKSKKKNTEGLWWEPSL